MAANERLCDGFGREPHEANGLWDTGHGSYLCDECYEEQQISWPQPELRPVADDGPTPPLGDPGEAGRSDAA